MEGTILSLNAGEIDVIDWQGKEVSTAINKQPVDGKVYLSKLNLEGDIQADTINHGGPDKAVCVYPHDHYPFWEKNLGISLAIPSFGENLTVSGMTEKEVCIGDIFELGDALVQVSQPRRPCYKVAAKLNQPLMVKYIQDTGFSGYYMRVLKEGQVNTGDKLVLKVKHQDGITVDFVNQMTFLDKENIEGIQRLVALEDLAEGWRTSLAKRLPSIPE